MGVKSVATASPSAATDEFIVRVENIRKTFGETVALNNVSLNVRKGEMFALLGASGSGKTTLLRLLAGFEHADQGHILIDGRDMTAVPPYDRPVNMMFQSYALFPHMTVGANIAFGLKQERGRARLSRSQISQRTKDALHLVRLDGFEHRRPHQLSGGQQQRVALARAIVKRPKLLLLDEPLAALDRKLRELTQIELVRIQAETGITFIIVTHDQEEAMSLSERMAVLHNGGVAQIGPPRQIYEFPNSVYVADFIGTANLFEGRVTSLSGEGARVDCPEIGGIVVVAAPPQATKVGDTLHIALRPERIAIALRETARTGAPNETVGTVRDMAFLGNQSRVAVELKSGKLIIAVQLNPGEEVEQCQAGTAVRLSWAARDCRGLVS
jgi:putrescine transport system ATP-binding protein